MNYPLLTEYIDAIQEQDNFDKLSDFKPVLGKDGKPIMSTGNFSVVFKMIDSKGKVYALKCFTKEQTGRCECYQEIAEELEYVSSTFITKVKFYPKELFVNTRVSEETEFPVVVMDWVEGLTLQEALENNLTPASVYELLLNFSKMSMWLISQPFSHGDLKPDNIIVRDDNSLVMVDYDGMYVPSLKGLPSRESGTPDYRHPQRQYNNIYDEHIDDFSIAVITLSLLLIFLDTSLYKNRETCEGLLFCERDFYDIRNCTLYQTQKSTYKSTLCQQIFSVFETCLLNNHLSKDEIYLLKIPEIFDESIIQGDNATTIISKLFWEMSHDDYLIQINLTENSLFFENENIEIKVEPHNKLLAVSTNLNNLKAYNTFTIDNFKRLLLSVNMWDEDTAAKIRFVESNMTLVSPELMVKSAEVFFEKNFPELINELSITAVGHTLTIVSKNGLQTIREQKSIFFMLANEVFQKNCFRFGVKTIIAIDGQTGQQEIFDIKNLTTKLT